MVTWITMKLPQNLYIRAFTIENAILSYFNIPKSYFINYTIQYTQHRISYLHHLFIKILISQPLSLSSSPLCLFPLSLFLFIFQGLKDHHHCKIYFKNPTTTKKKKKKKLTTTITYIPANPPRH